MSFMPKFVDLVRNTTTTVGTVDFALGAAAVGFTSFTAACQVGDTFYYSAIGIDKPAEREVGRGTLLSGGIIARDPINGAKTNFSAGSKSVSLIAAADWYDQAQQMIGNAGGYQVVAADRAALAASALTSAAYLKEPGREGLFVWNASNCSALVAADSQQGVHVPPASDPTGASGAWVRTFSGPLNAMWFGAKADAGPAAATGTDDTAAIQAAIDAAIAAGGGEVLIPAHSKCAGTLNLDNAHNVKLIGRSGSGGGYSVPPPAQLIYTGDGAAPFISAAHTNGIEIRDLGIRYTSASFTGDLIALTNTTGGADAAYGLVERCLVGGIGVHSARSCVSLEGAILCSLVDNHLQWATAGIRGAKSGGLYSNAHVITRNTFDNLTLAAIINPAQGWSIVGNFFEGTDGGSGGMPYAITSDLPAVGFGCGSLHYAGNWHGDATHVTDAWINFGNMPVSGANFAGNYFNTLGPTTIAAMKFPSKIEGASITGNTMNSYIDFAGIDHFGVSVTGNYYNSEIANLSFNSSDILIFGNKINSAFAQTIIRVTEPTEFSLGRAGGGTVAGGFDFTAPAATDLALRLFSDSGQNAWTQYFKGGHKRLAQGIDNSQNLVEVVYDVSGNFAGYHRTVSLYSFDVTYGGNVDLSSGKVYKVNGTQVVGARQTGTPADATDLASAIALVNDLKAKLVAHGLIA